MITIENRFLLFFIFCMGVRFSIALVAKNINIKLLKYMGYIFFIVAIRFAYIYVNDTFYDIKTYQPFSDKIWWNDLRPIHSFFYLLFSYNAISGNKYAWIYLLIDVLLGLISFLTYYFINL